ncbi:MAG TPA: L,D-transpeptidase [Candidatus Didemnitutus sp.]
MLRQVLFLILTSLVAIRIAGAPAAPPGGSPATATTHPTRPEDVPAIEEPPDDTPATEASPTPAGTDEKPAAPEAAPVPRTPPEDDLPPVKDWLEAQVELSRRGFSCGSIDGVGGAQSAAALKAFQRASGLRETGQLDKATKRVLHLTAPALAPYTFDVVDLSHLRPIPDTWVGKSQEPEMFFSTALELAGERCRTAPSFLKKLNPTMNWQSVLPGTVITAPSVERFVPPTHASRIHVRLADHVLEAVDDGEQVIFHCPVSIARKVEKRPVGELHVQVVIPDPVYTWDPELFPEYPESRELTHKLILPAGPNNPVGIAWIGLDRTGYGIHGTPEPENVGRTESHGCFRLANWDAQVMLRLCWEGLPVEVEP